MCGLHGVINKSNYNRTVFGDFIKDAFTANTLRGVHSSGIFQLGKDGKPYVFKEATPGYEFVEGKMAELFIKDAGNALITLCHVRHATAGEVNDNNAHPFTAHIPNTGNRLVGVHNGTLSGWKAKPGADKFSVDSQWALNHIAKHGPKAFEDISGAFTFIWWNEDEPDTVFMARNEQRPLHFVLTKDESAMLFASEAGMLSWLADRNKITTQDDMFELETGKLYKFDLSENKIKWYKSDLPRYSYVNVSNTSGTSNGRTGNNHSNYDYYGRSNNSRGYTSSSGTEFVDTRKDKILEAVKEGLRRNRDERNAATRSQACATESSCSNTNASAEEPKPRLNKKERRRLRAEERKKQRSAAKSVADVLTQRVDDGDYADRLREDWYSAATATTVERNVVKSLDLMGSLAWFVGHVYDAELCEVMGEFEEWDIAAKAKVKYHAVMRGISEGAAKARWLSGGDWVAIVGATPDKSGSGFTGREYVVAELNDTGKRAIRDRAA